jgi:cytochrome c oxidase cbb3-type subunit 3
MGGIGPALSNPDFLSASSDGFLQATMALGRTGTEMRPVTQNAGGIVEFERAKTNDVISFIRYQSEFYGTLKRYEQTAFGSISNGREWFVMICSKCHGNNGKGTDAAPGLNDMNFLGYASDGFLEGTVTRGRTGTPMRSFGLHGDGIASLTARQITDIVTYIRSWSKPLLFGAAEERARK